jgi:tonB-linked outer membrane protein, susC/ragA family
MFNLSYKFMKKKSECLGIYHYRWQKIGKMMKLCIILVCLFSFSLSATTLAQRERVSMKLQEVSLRQVLEQIREQTNLQFMMSKEQGERVGRVSVNAENATVAEVLDKVFASTGLTWVINEDIIVVKERPQSSVLSPAPDCVKGVVKDEKGNPLPGVTVRVKGTILGTSTDADGRFSLLLIDEKEMAFVFSFVGMQSQEVAYTGQKELNIVMQAEVSEIDEVVVTGYLNIDRRHLTSSVTSVRMDDIQKPGITNLNQMLEGKIPDMVVTSNSGEINATPRLRIRGTSTIIGNREPLWVVDGIIVNDPVNLSPDVLNDPDYVNRIGNAISGLNPQDIERLDVLKDAAATALYGIRAANGVIVVTTKRGHVGKPVISCSVTGTFRRHPRYTDDKINLMNSKERIQFSQQLVANHYIYPNNMPLTGYEYVLSRYYSGALTKEQFQTEVDRLQTMNTDWFDLLTKDSFSKDYAINVSGGSDNIRYYASLGYTSEDDVIRRTTNRRYTAAAKLDMTLSSRWRLSFNLNGYLNERKYTQDEVNPIDYAYNTSRAIPAFSEDGSYHFYGVYNRYGSYLNFNILNELVNSYKKQSTSNFTATVNLNYEVTEWLKLSATVSGSVNSANLNGHWGEKTHYIADLRGSDYGEKAPESSLCPYGGELATNNYNTKSYTARLQADFHKYLDENENHFLNVSIGAEANSSRYNAYSHTQRGYYDDRGKSFVTDLSPSSFPTYYSSWVQSNVPTITDNLTNLLSAYATATYGYKDYFTLNANTRYDGSNKFGSRSNEKLLPVWSVSGLVDLKTVSGLQLSWLESFSVKGSYGEQGNMLDGQTPVLVLKKGSYSDYRDEMISTVASGGFANPNLKWEKTRSYNLGAMASVFKNSLMINFEYYYKKTSDAFMSKTISDVNGFNTYVVNSGTLRNRGWNVGITATPVKTKDFNWILSGSLSKVTNTMSTLPGQETYELSDFLNGTAVVEGMPIGTFYSYKYMGLSPVDGGPMFDDWEDRKSELVDLDKYSVYTKVLVPSGQRDPDMTGSINNTFNYKQWRLGISLNYSIGGSTRLFRMMEDFVNGYSAEANINRDMLKAWKKPGDELTTDIPAIMGSASNGYNYYSYHWSSASTSDVVKIADNAWTMYDYSDLRVVSADYLKISSISLTYEFPRRILSRWKLERLALTLGATNLYTFCNSKLRGQTPTQGGFSDIQLSDTPTYTIGLNLNF